MCSKYAERFGFYSLPPLEMPENERVASGLYNRGQLFKPKHPEYQVDPGRLAFGQERLRGHADADGDGRGDRCERRRDHAAAPDRRRSSRPAATPSRTCKPDQLGRPISRADRRRADAHDGARRSRAAPARRLQIPGVRVAGKTGTAETGRGRHQHDLVHAFAPADKPQVAIAVVVENQRGGFGGTVAAPIAKQVMEALLR